MKKRKSIILITIIFTVLLNILFMCSTEVLATDDTTYISLSDNGITVDGVSISTDTSNNIYLTTSMNNGGSSEDALSANIEITNVININSSGTYEFTGTLSNGQIAVNSNSINGDVIIILNNVDITCKSAPAIFVYNSETDSSICTVAIKAASGSTNTVTGGKLKQSVEGWSDQSELLYYVDKGYDDDNAYYERYKYDGAISSDISLTFEGEGTLTINSTEKEGIESKRNITINSGTYIINSLDDGINACTDNESVITINGGTVVVNLQDGAEEGDGIDSNGSIYINGGKVFSFACETSQDNGLDADAGIYINGGYVVATGNMADTVDSDSEQDFIQVQFTSKVEKDTLITITDEGNNPIIAVQADRSYSILTVSTPNLGNGELYVYEGGTIDGTSEYGVYTDITSYEVGTIKEYSNTTDMRDFDKSMNNMNNEVITSESNGYYYIIAILVLLLIILIIIVIILSKKGEFTMKGKILTLIIGILIGAIITAAGFIIYNNVNKPDGDMTRGGQMQNDGNMRMTDGERPNGNSIDGEMPDGEMPNGEMPDGEIPSGETSDAGNNNI